MRAILLAIFLCAFAAMEASAGFICANPANKVRPFCPSQFIMTIQNKMDGRVIGIKKHGQYMRVKLKKRANNKIILMTVDPQQRRIIKVRY